MKTQTVEAEKASELFTIAKEKQWAPIMIIGIEPIYEQAGDDHD